MVLQPLRDLHWRRETSARWPREISETEMKDEFCGDYVRKNNHLDNVSTFRDRIKPSEEIVKAARSKIGQKWGYNFMTHNCEHFATWCRYGREVSLQSCGIGDLFSRKLSFVEFIECIFVKSIEEAVWTLDCWCKRLVVGKRQVKYVVSDIIILNI